MKLENAVKLLRKFGTVQADLCNNHWAVVNGSKVMFWAPRDHVRYVWVEGPARSTCFPTLARALAAALYQEHILSHADHSVFIAVSFNPLRGLKRTVRLQVDGLDVCGSHRELTALIEGAIQSNECAGLVDWVLEHEVSRTGLLILI